MSHATIDKMGFQIAICTIFCLISFITVKTTYFNEHEYLEKKYSICLCTYGFDVQSLGMELGKYGISVTAVARGLSRVDPLLVSSSEQEVQEAGKVVPLQRWMKPGSDLKSLVLHLVTNAGKHMTASVVIADGGQSIPRARMRSFM